MNNGISLLAQSRTMLRRIVPVAAVMLSGCFATQQDIRVLQSDLVLMRNESVTSDSAQLVQVQRLEQKLDQTMKAFTQINRLSDSIAGIGTQLARFRSDLAGSISSMQQQIVQLQELIGQSQRSLREVGATLEQRQTQLSSSQPGALNNPSGELAPPGPNELYKVAREQYNQGSYDAARTAFNELIKSHPKAEIVPQALFYIAQSYTAEGKAKQADSVYAAVVKTYPNSDVAPMALYKRGVAAQTAGKTTQARTLFTEVAKKYPRSEEAALARDRIEELDQKD